MTDLESKELSENIKKFKRKIFLFIAILAALLLFGLFIFIFIEKYPFEEALSKTFETFIFIIHSQEGISRYLEIFLALFGVILIWWTLWSIFDLLIEGSLREYLKTSGFLSKMRKMRNHYIIAGGGRVGEEIASSLRKNKKEYIIIEKDENKIKKLKRLNFSVIKGDVADSDNSDLIAAGIKNAKTIILAMPETEKNLLVTMTAKELNPKIEVYARADNPAFVSKLKKAGAKVVIVPELAAAERFIEAIK